MPTSIAFIGGVFLVFPGDSRFPPASPEPIPTFRTAISNLKSHLVRAHFTSNVSVSGELLFFNFLARFGGDRTLALIYPPGISTPQARS
jgi:hypothetical protein